MHEKRACDTAGLRKIGQRDIVVNNNHFDVEAKGFGPLGGEAKVQPVARIVFHDQQTASRSCHGQNAGQHGIYTGRGEDVTTHGRRQHAFADKAGMGRLMARAAP